MDFSLAGRRIDENQHPALSVITAEQSSKQSSNDNRLQNHFHAENTSVIDASNVAWSGPGKPQISRMQTVISEFSRVNVSSICIADASLRYTIDDKTSYESMVSQGTITQVPAETSADIFIRETTGLLSSSKFRPIVVTNDRNLARFVFPAPCLKFLFIRIGQATRVLFHPKFEELGLIVGESNK
jgi:hypothetical protein